MTTPFELDVPRCLYAGTATAPPATPPLATETRADVAVIGGGFTGLSTALHLAERGRAVALLEAREPGWGAAGRNGGQVNAGLKHEPDEVERDFGPVYGPRLVRIAGSAPDFLFALIERLALDCDARRSGTLRVAYAPQHLAGLRASVDQWQRRGTRLEFWDAARVTAATGTGRYVGALFDPRGGSVNPLSLARGLARAAQRAGAAVYGSTPATGLARERAGWRVTTPAGSVSADRVVIATDGYSDDLWPGLRTSIVPVFSSIIATAPLPAALAASVLPEGQVVYESGNITVYYRRDGENRLLMGGRGLQRDATARHDFRHLARYATRLWPVLSSVEWTHWWNGQFALTPDFYPRFHMPAAGLYVALGYSGRGVALGTALGAEIASVAAGDVPASFPLPATPVPQIPMHRFWKLGVAARMLQGRLLDRLGR